MGDAERDGTLDGLFAGFAEGAKLVIMGVGNPCHPYDAVGLTLARDLENSLKRTKNLKFEVGFVRAETLPENFTGVVRRMAPDHVVLLDAADRGDPPYGLHLLTDAELDRATVSCHKIPFSLYKRFLTDGTPLTLHVVGVQTVAEPDRNDPGYRAALAGLKRLFRR